MRIQNTTHLKPIASDCDQWSGLQKCNRLEELITHAYIQYQEEMCAMGNTILADNFFNILKRLNFQPNHNEKG